MWENLSISSFLYNGVPCMYQNLGNYLLGVLACVCVSG